jgi:hypothetical protein
MRKWKGSSYRCITIEPGMVYQIQDQEHQSRHEREAVAEDDVVDRSVVALRVKSVVGFLSVPQRQRKKVSFLVRLKNRK